MNNTLVSAAKKTVEQLAPKAPVVPEAAAGSSATTFLPNLPTISMASIKNLIPSVSVPQWVKTLGNFNATAVLKDTSASIGNAKDATVKALGDALSAVIPDAIENAAKAHPAVAGFVAGASIVGAVAYRKEIKESVTSGVSSAATYATYGKDFVAAKLGKKQAPAKEAKKDEPVVKKSPDPIPVAVVVSPASAPAKQPSPKAAAAGWSSYLPSFRSATPAAQTAAPKTSPATATSPAAATKTSPAKPGLAQPDLAKALAATNAASEKHDQKDAPTHGAKVKKRKAG